MKKGFTLAEVLITLAIIGVVAALTIPTVIAKYNQHAQYTAFMKMYNTITNVLSLVEGEEGKPNVWNYDYHVEAQVIQFLKSHIYSHFKISKICESSTADCFSPYEIKGLNGSEMGSSDEVFMGNGLTVILDDGSFLMVVPIEHDAVIFLFDTNGTKGPNLIGRDIFELMYISDGNGKWGFDFSDNSHLSTSYCDPNSSSGAGEGGGCAAKLLQEGKMNY